MWYEIHWAVFILFALSFGCMFVYLTSSTNLWVEPGAQGSDIFYHWNIGQRLSEGFLCNSNSVSIQEVNQSMNGWQPGVRGRLREERREAWWERIKPRKYLSKFLIPWSNVNGLWAEKVIYKTTMHSNVPLAARILFSNRAHLYRFTKFQTLLGYGGKQLNN